MAVLAVVSWFHYRRTGGTPETQADPFENPPNGETNAIPACGKLIMTAMTQPTEWMLIDAFSTSQE